MYFRDFNFKEEIKAVSSYVVSRVSPADKVTRVEKTSVSRDMMGSRSGSDVNISFSIALEKAKSHNKTQGQQERKTGGNIYDFAGSMNYYNNRAQEKVFTVNVSTADFKG